ncbi:restriction endonuclease subunit S [uncultured Prevotella sp.]|uniref:restriction endonuclease subunit S n=1 Tax=uncultured Prevotella sp. TaxID=159272 RepID=UPI002597BA97|nr:restriction endonuclease subunit S [uncultured Prevotella sp.]
MREGWEYKKFENCIVKSPKLKQVKKEAYNNGSQYPIISQEEKFISGYCDDESMVCHIDRPIVVFGDHTRVLKYIDFDFVVGADGVKVIIPIKSIDSKFLLYFLQWYNIPNLGYSRHYKLLKDVMVPIPNCTTQQTIISELDKLNKLIQIKKEQLKDYDALAQSIFYEMFGDPVVNEKGWEVKKFGDLFKLKSGDGLSSKDFKTGIYPVYGGNGISGYHNSFNMKGCYIIIGRVGVYCGNVRKVEGEFWLTDNAFRLIYKENEQNPFFILYLLNILDLHQYANAAAQPVISNLTLKSINVPLPPLSLQQSFAHKIEQIEQQKAAIQKTITDLETLLAARMQYWFD